MARKKKERKEEQAQVPISAMIDIVFLLIIFFVVTAAIDQDIQDESIVLANAPHGKPLTKKDPRTLTINVRRDGTINIAQIPMDQEQLKTQLLSAASKYGMDTPIVIRGDAGAQHYYIKKVMKSITDIKLYKVKFDAEISSQEK